MWIKKSFLVIIILCLPIAFLLGVSVGEKKEKKSFADRLKNAIRQGKSVIVDDFIITADKQWTKKHHVNYIWIAGSGDEGVRKVWE